MKIFIDTNTFADAPAVYADAEKTQALPRVLPLVQGFKGMLTVGFLGDRAPSKSARAIFAARPLGSKTDVVQTAPGVIRVAGDVTMILFDITADTTQLAEALGDAESLAVRAGVVVEEEELCKPARSEWQLTFSVSATALGGDQPDPRPSEADELRSEIAAEAACRAAADAELLDALGAEAACRKSELLRVDSKFSETACALGELSDELGEKADAADAVLLAAADSAEKNAESKHGKAALLTVDGGEGGVYISGLAGATRADEKWIAKARHDGVRVFRAPGAAPENFGYYAGACFCAGDVFARAKDVACSRADVCRSMAAQRDALRSEIAAEAVCRAAADAALCARICAVEISAGGGIPAACVDAKIAAEAACRAAADAEALDALDAESACRKAEILRLDSNFSELSDALGEKADAADAVLLAAADSAEKNAASKHGKAALLTVNGGDGGVYISGNRDGTRADEKWIAKARHDGVRVYRAPGAAPENFGYYAGACFCAGDVIARAKDVACARADVCRSMVAQRDELRAEIASEAACRAAADAALRTDIDALDASFGEALCAQRSELQDWANGRFVCRGGDIVVGYGSRLEFADSEGATAAAMRFTDSPTGGVLSIGSASTDAAMTWMSGNYMSWFSPEFLRLYSGKCVVSPTAKVEVNPNGVILAAGANDVTKIVIDEGKIQVSGAPLTLDVAPTASAHAATKGYVDAADAALCARICKIEKCGASTACALPAACVDARIANAVGSEAACRAAADAALQARADELDACFGASQEAQSSELRAAWTQDIRANAQALYSEISAESAKALSTEIQSREWADENLCRKIYAERVAREGFEKAAKACLNFIVNTELPGADARLVSAVGSEAACRAAADAELLDALDAEAACRKSEILRVDSKFSELSEALDAEEVAREKAVGAEAACRTAADACLRRCIGARDSDVRALCGTVSSLRTCVNAINTNVGCVYPQIPKICSKLAMISACAARLDSRVEALEDGGDVEAQIAAEAACRKAADAALCARVCALEQGGGGGDVAAEAACRKAADAALCSRVRALEDSTEYQVLRRCLGDVADCVIRVRNCLLVAKSELYGDIDALDARVEALEQGGGGGGGGGGGDATLAGNNVWTGCNVFLPGHSASFVVGSTRGTELLRVGSTSPGGSEKTPVVINDTLVDLGDMMLRAHRGITVAGTSPFGDEALTVYDCGRGGMTFVQCRGGFASISIKDKVHPSASGRVLVPNPALCRSWWDDPYGASEAGVVLSSPKSVMLEFVTMSEFNAVPGQCKTCHSLYFILCGDEPL